jgi:hypothetical protein
VTTQRQVSYCKISVTLIVAGSMYRTSPTARRHLDIDMSNHIRSLEERLLDPAVRKDSEQVSTLLADDFVEFGSSGRTFDKAQVLEYLRDELPQEKALIRNFVAKALSSKVFLITYRATRRDVSGVHHSDSWRCSIWVKRDGRWQLQFHQGTKIPIQLSGRRRT